MDNRRLYLNKAKKQQSCINELAKYKSTSKIVEGIKHFEQKKVEYLELAVFYDRGRTENIKGKMDKEIAKV